MTMLTTQTQALFFETADRPEETAPYTLKDYDHVVNGKTYLSLSRLYIQAEDPVEYDFATKYLVNYEHWQRLCKAWFFKNHIKAWREELNSKLKTKAVKSIIQELDNPQSKHYFQAVKFIADNAWNNNTSTDKLGKGRPKKVEVEDTSLPDKRVKEDFERIMSLETDRAKTTN